MTIVFFGFDAFGIPSKGRLFAMDTFKWAPEGLGVWLFDRDKSPGMAKLRENKMCAHEVAAKLIEEKKQVLTDGTSRKDVLSLLGEFRPPSRFTDER